MTERKDVNITPPTAEAKSEIHSPTIMTSQICWEKDWWKLGIVFVLTIVGQIILPVCEGSWCSSCNCWGVFSLGFIISFAAFFGGLLAVTKVIKKTIIK